MKEAQIKAMIVAELEKGPRTVPAIHQATGLSRLTVRAYIDRMVKGGEVVGTSSTQGRYSLVPAISAAEEVAAGDLDTVRDTSRTLAAIEDEPDTVDLAEHAEVAEGAIARHFERQTAEAEAAIRCGTGVPLDKLPPGDREAVAGFARFLEASHANPDACYVVREGAYYTCHAHKSGWLTSLPAPDGCQSPDDGEPGDFEAKLAALPSPPVAEPGVVAWTTEPDGGMVPVRVADVPTRVTVVEGGQVVGERLDLPNDLPAAFARRHGSAADAVVEAKDPELPDNPRWPRGTAPYDAFQAHLTATLKTWRETGFAGREEAEVEPSSWFVERIDAAVVSKYAAAVGFIEAAVRGEGTADERLEEVRVILASLDRVIRRK